MRTHRKFLGRVKNFHCSERNSLHDRVIQSARIVIDIPKQIRFAAMKLRVYEGHTCWVLVPDFLKPPSCTAIYEPLRDRGCVESTAGDAPELRYIQLSLSHSLYAAVPERVVVQLWPQFAIPATTERRDPL